MHYSKVFSLLFLFAFCCTASAQNNQFKKADRLYKINEYSDAISFYEEGLQEEKSLSAKTKLAYCYKMTNNLSRAEKLYSEIVVEKRARPITKYYYGGTLMSNGKYTEARSWFLEYAEINPDDKRALEMANACEQVSAIKPMFENIEINSFVQNSKADDSGPVFYKNGIVFTSDRKSGINPLKQKTGWTGRDYLKMYYSEADSSGTYQKPKDFSTKLNELNKHCGSISLNEDQNFVVFTKTGTYPGKNDAFNMQLFYSELNKKAKWRKAKTLPFCDENKNYMHPSLSADGKTLYFVSNKPGGEGGTDIYKSRMTESGWSVPLNLGDIVNTSYNEGFPFIAPDGKLYFSSKGHAGYGGFDIFCVELDSKGLWSKLRNIGTPVNSSHDDISFHHNAAFTKCVFSSSREDNNDNIYIFDITPATIINKYFEEPEEIYEDKDLLATNTYNGNSDAVAIVAAEETEMTRPNSDAQNIEKSDEVNIPNEYANNSGNAAASFKETGGIVEAENMEAMEIDGTEDTEDFGDPFVYIGDINLNNEKQEEAEGFSDGSAVTVNKTNTAEVGISDNRVEKSMSNPDTPEGETETVAEIAEGQIQEGQNVNNASNTQTEVVEIEETEFLKDTIIPEDKKLNTENDEALTIQEVEGFNDDPAVSANEKIAEEAEEAEVGVAEAGILDGTIEKINLNNNTPGVESETVTEATESQTQDEQKTNNTSTTKTELNDLSSVPDINNGRPEPTVYPFVQMKYLLKKGNNVKGKTFRINGIEFEKGKYGISEEIILRLNLMVDILEQYPDLTVKIAVHSNSIGDDDENMEVTKARAKTIAEHLISQGITTERINAEGYGESHLLNHCTNGVNCTEKEQNINERVEITVL